VYYVELANAAVARQRWLVADHTVTGQVLQQVHESASPPREAGAEATADGLSKAPHRDMARSQAPHRQGQHQSRPGHSGHCTHDGESPRVQEPRYIHRGRVSC
jgi:hypothetical protein